MLSRPRGDAFCVVADALAQRMAELRLGTRPRRLVPEYAPIARHALEVAHENIRRLRERRRVVELHTAMSHRGASETTEGDRRYEQIDACLDSMGIERSPIQKEFHDAFKKACMAFIYGAEWTYSQARIMRRHGMTRMRREVMILTMRQVGKTLAQQMFAAALAWCIPHIKIAIFSRTGRQTRPILEGAINMLKSMEGWEDDMKMFKNQERFVFMGPTRKPGDVRSIYAYPGGTQVRGVCACVRALLLLLLLCIPRPRH